MIGALASVKTPARFREPRTGLPPLPRRSGLITLDPGLQRVAVRFIKAVSPALARAYDLELRPVAQAAFDAWPVKTGRSRDELGLHYSSDGVEFTGAIVAAAPYSMLIVSDGVHVVRDLIWTHGEAAADRMVDQILVPLERGAV